MILGPSGSGKSTLMNILGGIDRGDSGRVIVGGTEISRLNADKLTDYRRENIGFVFQFYNLVPNLTVAENIEVVSNISKFPLNTDEVLAAVRIKDKKHRFPREALRRRATKGFHCQGDRQKSAAAAVRRADRCAGFRYVPQHLAASAAGKPNLRDHHFASGIHGRIRCGGGVSHRNDDHLCRNLHDH